MYIANVGKQKFLFSYRVPEKKATITQEIWPGKQTALAPAGYNTEMSSEDIEAVIQQFTKYGMRDIDKIDEKHYDIHGVERPFGGLCFSFKPITEAKIRKAVDKVERALVSRGREIREEAAVVANYEVENRMGDGFQLRKGFNVTVEEVEPKQGFSDETTHILEDMHVTRSPSPDHAVIDIAKRGR
jgi:hypothetical protein